MTSLINRVRKNCTTQSSATTPLRSPISSDDDLNDEFLHQELLRHPSETDRSERVENKNVDVERIKTVLEHAREFATLKGVSVIKVKTFAKRLGLRTTQTKRQHAKFTDRLSFGLTKRERTLVVKESQETPPTTLFKFGGREDGLLYASNSSKSPVSLGRSP